VTSGAHEDYPQLHQVLGGYLHQDWDLDWSTWREAIHAALSEGGRSQLRSAAQELAMARQQCSSEDDAGHWWSHCATIGRPAKA
jgi:hypothetical protein